MYLKMRLFFSSLPIFIENNGMEVSVLVGLVVCVGGGGGWG